MAARAEADHPGSVMEYQQGGDVEYTATPERLSEADTPKWLAI